jgi:hypothetical protein
MKYEVALKEKNVKKEDLSKKLQAKIDSLVKKVNSAKTPEQIENVDKLDTEISNSINKFDPEVQKRRLASIANINDKRSAEGPKSERKPEAETEVEEEGPVTPEEEAVTEIAPGEIIGNPYATERQKGTTDRKKLRMERIEELQKKAVQAEYLKYKQEEERQKQLERQRPRHRRIEQEEVNEVNAEEIEDFQKVKSVRPKGNSLSVTLMGIGVFFLTWGAVNYFRTRKG